MVRYRDRGALLVVLLLLIVVATLVGVWGLSATQTGLVKAGHHRGATSLVYQAEEGIQKAVRRIQEIADPNLDDSLSKASSGYSGAQLQLGSLVNPLLFPPESLADPKNPSCPEPFDPGIGLNLVANDGKSNVICNFMGYSMEDTQVSLVRKDDQIEGTRISAVFLINAISRDSQGRRQMVQAVAILPYEGDETSGYTLPVGENAYLASIVKVAE